MRGYQVVEGCFQEHELMAQFHGLQFGQILKLHTLLERQIITGYMSQDCVAKVISCVDDGNDFVLVIPSGDMQGQLDSFLLEIPTSLGIQFDHLMMSPADYHHLRQVIQARR